MSARFKNDQSKNPCAGAIHYAARQSQDEFVDRYVPVTGLLNIDTHDLLS
jgi:hypothetical protein